MAAPLSAAQTSPPASLATEDAAAHQRPAGRTVRQTLGLLAVSLVLPVLLFSAFVLWRFAEAERQRIEGEASDIAQSVATALDREMTGIFASLDVLSTSAYLKTGDFVGFRNQAVELFQRQGLVTVLSDLAGQQLVNVRLPEGAPLPLTTTAIDPVAIKAGRPFVTDFVVGQVSGNRQFLAVMPVRRGDADTYLLLFSIPLERLQRILLDAEIGPTYTVSIVDRKGVIMARSVRFEEFVGREASQDLRREATGQRGTWMGTTVDGLPVFGSYARSRLSGFRAAVGIRESDLNAPLWRSLSLFATLGVAVTALSVLLAFVFGKRIAAPISALSREAKKLGRGQPVAPLASGLVEADEVGAELADASEKLRDRETDLREANEEIQRFAYIVSHDLRSPLVNIMGFTTELEALRSDVARRLEGAKVEGTVTDGARDEDFLQDFDEALGFIKASIGKMDRLINAILHLSRQGQRQFQPERVDMKSLLSTIRDSLATQSEAADAAVIVPELPTLVSDRLALEQIFSNLVDNALKYLRKGVAGRVEIVGQVRGPNVIYEVRDNGRGIDERDRERVFDLFRRSGVQDRPGEGIGLAHVRALVRRLGGNIGLTSEPGRGSTFIVTLPRRWAGERRRKVA